MDKDLSMDKVAFIVDPTRRQFILRTKDNVRVILKVTYNDSVDFLYTQYHFGCESPLQIKEKMEYAGFVHYPSGRIFDGSYNLFRFEEEIDTISLDTLKNEAEQAIRSTVVARVGMKPVTVTDMAEDYRNDRKSFEEHGANERARRDFFKGNHMMEYSPYISLEPTTEDTIQMVMDMDKYVEEWADNYILTKANKINERLWEIGIAQKQLELLWNTPGDHHITKAIAEAIPDDVKMVNLHLDKDGIQIVVKFEAAYLRAADTTDYNTWCFDAPGRREFESAYGRYTKLLPSDIQRITYGKKVLYERKEGG